MSSILLAIAIVPIVTSADRPAAMPFYDASQPQHPGNFPLPNGETATGEYADPPFDDFPAKVRRELCRDDIASRVTAYLMVKYIAAAGFHGLLAKERRATAKKIAVLGEHWYLVAFGYQQIVAIHIDGTPRWSVVRYGPRMVRVHYWRFVRWCLDKWPAIPGVPPAGPIGPAGG